MNIFCAVIVSLSESRLVRTSMALSRTSRTNHLRQGIDVLNPLEFHTDLRFSPELFMAVKKNAFSFELTVQLKIFLSRVNRFRNKEKHKILYITG